MCRDHFSKSGPGGKNKICLSKIRSLWEKLRLFKVRLNPLASNSRATLARFVRTLQAYISAPSDPILLPHILFFASGSDLKKSSLSFFTEKFSSTWKVTSTETDILSNFLQRVSQAVSLRAQPGQPSTLNWLSVWVWEWWQQPGLTVWLCRSCESSQYSQHWISGTCIFSLRRVVQQRCILSAGISRAESSQSSHEFEFLSILQSCCVESVSFAQMSL